MMARRIIRTMDMMGTMSISIMKILACTLRHVEVRDKPDSPDKEEDIAPPSLPAALTLGRDHTRPHLVGMELPGMDLLDDEARRRGTCHRRSH
jgi:hypothetical protein